jgi:hypothetical protein
MKICTNSNFIRGVLGFIFGASVASLCFFSKNHEVVPISGWSLFVCCSALMGFWIGFRGTSVRRDRFGVALILLGAFFYFSLGSARRVFIYNPTEDPKMRWVEGSILLFAVAVAIRLCIWLARSLEARSRR